MLKISDRFSRLLVVSFFGVVKSKRFYMCLCDCGVIIKCSENNLKTGNTNSCGCYKLDAVRLSRTKHGMCTTVEYNSWKGMKKRCNNENCNDYAYYGGRGISVCEKWSVDFSAFFFDMGKCPDGYSIDRIDVNKGYFKDNCRWACNTTQARNQRVRKDNKSGCKGVYFDRDSGKYRAMITVSKKSISLGRFLDLNDAIAARKSAELLYWC